jgi:hypothetical protein
MKEIIINENSRQYLLSQVTDEESLKSVCALRIKVCFQEMGLVEVLRVDNLLDEHEDIKKDDIKIYCMYDKEKLIGSGKITYNYDLMQWDNIFLDFKNNLKDEKIAEGSFLAFEKSYRFGLSPILMAFGISETDYNDYRYFYVQSKEETLNYYQQYGFKIAGKAFRLDGWKGNWYPMIMDIKDEKEKFTKNADNLPPMVKKFWKYFYVFLGELEVSCGTRSSINCLSK